jgi:hypothetical protein
MSRLLVIPIKIKWLCYCFCDLADKAAQELHVFFTLSQNQKLFDYLQ